MDLEEPSPDSLSVCSHLPTSPTSCYSLTPSNSITSSQKTVTTQSEDSNNVKLVDIAYLHHHHHHHQNPSSTHRHNLSVASQYTISSTNTSAAATGSAAYCNHLQLHHSGTHDISPRALKRVSATPTSTSDKNANAHVQFSPQQQRNHFFLNIDVAKRSCHLSLLQLLVVGGLEIVVLVYTCTLVTWWLEHRTNVMNNPTASVNCINFADFAASDCAFLALYFCLFLVSLIYQYILVVDSALNKNAAQALTTQVFNMCCFAYSAIQLKQLTSIYNSQDCGSTVPIWLEQRLEASIDIVIAVVVLMAIFVMAGSLMALLLFKDYRWSIYTELSGASISKRNAIRRHHFFLLFLKLNIFFSMAITIMVGVAIYFASSYQPHNRDMSIEELALDPEKMGMETVIIDFVVLAIVCFVYYGIGFLAVRRGSRWAMGLFLAIMVIDLCALSYILWVVRMDVRFEGTVMFLTWFISIQILVNVGTMYVGLLCWRDFTSFENYRKMVKRKKKKFKNVTVELKPRVIPVLD